MTNSFKVMGALVFAAAGLNSPGVRAADGDDSFNGLMEQYRGRPAVTAEWQNPLMPAGTGEYALRSADEILTATLRIYTRDVLDRGYWVNEWVDGATGYDAGNPLLAVNTGSGVTLKVAGVPADHIVVGAVRGDVFGMALTGL
jgi:hypothetical protein